MPDRKSGATATPTEASPGPGASGPRWGRLLCLQRVESRAQTLRSRGGPTRLGVAYHVRPQFPACPSAASAKNSPAIDAVHRILPYFRPDLRPKDRTQRMMSREPPFSRHDTRQGPRPVGSAPGLSAPGHNSPQQRPAVHANRLHGAPRDPAAASSHTERYMADCRPYWGNATFRHISSGCNILREPRMALTFTYLLAARPYLREAYPVDQSLISS